MLVHTDSDSWLERESGSSLMDKIEKSAQTALSPKFGIQYGGG